MATRYDAVIGETVTLEAKFLLDGDPFDPFEIVKVELVDEALETIETKDGSEVTQIATGHYSVEFGPLTQSGTLCDHWHFIAADGAEVDVLIFLVEVAGVEGEPGEGEDPEEPTPPDIGEENTVIVTHTFYDAGGRAFQGVYVRFRPNPIPVELSGFVGSIARDIDGVSNEDGDLEALGGGPYRLVRGITGLLAITGIGLVREVTTPDVATIDLLDLMAAGDDRFEVQDVDFIDLPRRS